MGLKDNIPLEEVLKEYFNSDATLGLYFKYSGCKRETFAYCDNHCCRIKLIIKESSVLIMTNINTEHHHTAENSKYYCISDPEFFNNIKKHIMHDIDIINRCEHG